MLANSGVHSELALKASILLQVNVAYLCNTRIDVATLLQDDHKNYSPLCTCSDDIG